MSDPIPSDRADAPSIVTVLVADDQRLVREGIASLLDIQEGISVVGEAANGQEACQLAAQVEPDVVVDNLPHHTFQGEDAQLKAAIAHLQERLRPPLRYDQPLCRQCPGRSVRDLSGLGSLSPRVRRQ